ncbi:S-layer protein [Bacillus thuringiensis]|nr:S-layer protein [Bacillus thuringiensis]
MYTKLLKTITSITLLSGTLLYAGDNLVKADNISFRDVPTNHWAYSAITDLTSKNIISGYGDGTFGLGDTATREQVATMIHRVLYPTKKGGSFDGVGSRYVVKDGSVLENPYKDINQTSTMFPEEILTLTKAGIFKGDESGKFRPKDSVSRAEMAQIIKNTFKVPVQKKHTFKDVPNNFWAEESIGALQSNNIATGSGDGNFEPYNSVTREQFAQFLYNALEYTKRTQDGGQTDSNPTQKNKQMLAEFKKEVKKHIDAYETEIVVPFKTKNENRQEVRDTLFNAYKEVLNESEYVKNNVANTSYYLSGSPGNYALNLTITSRESKEQTEYVMAKSKAVVRSIIQNGMDEHEKVKAIHDYVVKHVAYDTSYTAYTGYDALAKGSAVCQGYVLLTYQLLKDAGIDSHIVVGNGNRHAWNMVKIDNKWYHLDTTWDDPIPDKQGRVVYNYFNLSDEQISKDHTWNRSEYPQASTDYSNIARTKWGLKK